MVDIMRRKILVVINFIDVLRLYICVGLGQQVSFIGDYFVFFL